MAYKWGKPFLNKSSAIKIRPWAYLRMGLFTGVPARCFIVCFSISISSISMLRVCVKTTYYPTPPINVDSPGVPTTLSLQEQHQATHPATLG